MINHQRSSKIYDKKIKNKNEKNMPTVHNSIQLRYQIWTLYNSTRYLLHLIYFLIKINYFTIDKLNIILFLFTIYLKNIELFVNLGVYGIHYGVLIKNL